MPKTCLIIDDEPQDDTIERIEAKLKTKHVHAQLLQFNIGSVERRDLLTDGHIDTDKVVGQFIAEFTGKRLDLICIDYLLDDEKVNGLDILKAIYPRRPNTAFLMYSSSLERLTKGIIDGYDENKDKRLLLEKIKTLTKYRVLDYVPRDRYDDAIIQIITKNQPSIELMIEEKLLNYPDLVFQNTYPVFQGKTLQAIATEIRIGSIHGNKYMEELIEVAISNMILVNNIPPQNE
jgi:hypothetical protein